MGRVASTARWTFLSACAAKDNLVVVGVRDYVIRRNETHLRNAICQPL